MTVGKCIFWVTYPWVTYLAAYFFLSFLCRTNLCPTIMFDQHYILCSNRSTSHCSEKCEKNSGLVSPLIKLTCIPRHIPEFSEILHFDQTKRRKTVNHQHSILGVELFAQHLMNLKAFILLHYHSGYFCNLRICAQQTEAKFIEVYFHCSLAKLN